MPKIAKRKRKQMMLAASANAGCTVQAPVTSDEDNSDLEVGDMLDDDDGDHDLEEDRYHFLTQLKPGQLMGKKKLMKRALAEEACDVSRKRARHEKQSEGMSSSDEAEFEKMPRPSTWELKAEKKGVRYLLPLKATHGKLILQEPTGLEDGNSDEGSTSSDSSSPLAMSEAGVDVEGEEGEKDEEEPPRVLTAAELLAECEEKLAKKKESISLIESQLVENPEGSIGQLKLLRAMCVERDPDMAVKIRKLAMRSFTSVMKDIAPSYHIRQVTAAEKAVKVSKDVKRIRHFEETILLDYRLFLSQCDETIRAGLGIQGGPREGKKRRRERKKPVLLLEDGQALSSSSVEYLADVALSCLCDLLVALPHFNFRNNLLATLVPLMTSKEKEGKVSQICCSTIESLFHDDLVGDVSFEAVQLIARMVKAKSYKTKPAVLRAFLHLRLHDVDRPVATTGAARPRTKEEKKMEAKQKLTKKQRRRLNAEAKLEKDLHEANAEENKEKKTKIQTETLKIVFLTYFRILKHSRHSPLLEPVLEGLAKFSHLINVDFFADLMSVLHSLAETGGLSNKECMQCALTAFEILSGQGSALNIDPRQFYTQLYSGILQLEAGSSDTDMLLAMDCLDKLLRNHRQVSIQRVLGYVKRLSTVTLQLLPGAALAVLATIKKFVQAYSQCEQLLDVDAMAGSGVYRPDVPDPEMSSASSTSLWELADLRLCYEPTVAAYTHHVLHGAPSQGNHSLHPNLARRTPKQFLSDFSLHLDSEQPTEPMANVPQPPPHPALKLAQRKKGKYHYLDRGIVSAQVREKAEEAMKSADISLQHIKGTSLHDS